MLSSKSFGRRDFVVEIPYNPSPKREGSNLHLQIGDVVKDVDKVNGDFWKGRLNDRVGYFPKTHVKELRLSDIIFQSDKTCRAIYDFEPSNPTELRLQQGDEVHVLEEAGLGWWKGRLGDKVGIFPASHILVCKENEQSNGTDYEKVITRVESPVQLRPRSTRYSPGHLSMDQMNFKLSSQMFDPEDEPAIPLYDSSIDDVQAQSSSSTGIFQKIRKSLDGSMSFRRRRNSSGSFLDTQSTCSPAVGRRRMSFASIFKRRSTSSNSLDPTNSIHDGVKQSSSMTQLKKSESLSIGIQGGSKMRGWRSMRDSEESLSWVYEETEGKRRGREFRGHRTLDSGISVDCDDGPFGPIEGVSDEVFEEMFASNREEEECDEEVLKNVPEDSVLENESRRLRGKMKTSAGRFNLSIPNLVGQQGSGKRTNPFVFWKPKDKGKVTDI